MQVTVVRCKSVVLALPLLLWLVGVLVHPFAKAFVWGVLSVALFAIDAAIVFVPSFLAWFDSRFKTVACLVWAPQVG